MRVIVNFFKGLYPLLMYIGISLGVGFALGIMLVAKQGLDAMGVKFIPDSFESMLTSQLNLLIVVSILAIIVFSLLIKIDLKKKTVDNKVKDKNVFVVLLIGSIAMALFFNIIINFLNLEKIDPIIKEVNKTLFESENIFFSLIMTAVLAPIVEEEMFRYLSYESYKKSFSPKAAIIITAILFALFHGNITQGIYAFFLGLIFAYAYEKTSNLLYVIGMHMAANLFISILLLTGALEKIFENNILSFACIPGCALIILYMLKILKNIGGEKLEDTQHSDTVL